MNPLVLVVLGALVLVLVLLSLPQSYANSEIHMYRSTFLLSLLMGLPGLEGKPCSAFTCTY